MDRLAISSGEAFSFWGLVGLPTAEAGYRHAAAIKDGVLAQDMGGALCLLSTVIFNVAMLSGATITERKCHSVDSYGEQRYFELGRDAAVEHGYVDIRFRNDFASGLLLRASTFNGNVVSEIWSAELLNVSVEITVAPALKADIEDEISDAKRDHRLALVTSREVQVNGLVMRTDAWTSSYQLGH